MKLNLFSRSIIAFTFVLFILIFPFFILSCKKKPMTWMKTFSHYQDCLVRNNFRHQDLSVVWSQLPFIVEKCAGTLYKTLNVTKLENYAETKHFIMPLQEHATCEVVTLGIGGETMAEELLKAMLPQCNFFGVDSGSKNSEKMYKERLNGGYLQGLVGAVNGTYKASVLENDSYVEKILPHFSLEYVFSKYHKKGLIDLLIMDIEGDEFKLFKDMIDNPNMYPTICQLNVEFHDPYKINFNVMDMFEKMSINGPYMILKTDYIFTFNRAFFININSSLCIEKYFLIKK